jgi:hypothetical protein
MFDYRWIKVGHLCIQPRKNILVFLKKRFVSCDFLRGACSANGDFLYDSRFDGSVNFDSGGDIGHVSLFQRIEGRDRVIEPIYIP